MISLSKFLTIKVSIDFILCIHSYIITVFLFQVLNVSSATDDTIIRCPSSSLIPEGATNQTYRAFQISIDTNKNKDDASNFVSRMVDLCFIVSFCKSFPLFFRGTFLLCQIFQNCFGGGKCTSVNCEIGTFMYDSFISVDINYEVDANLYNIINVSNLKKRCILLCVLKNHIFANYSTA